jgi:hypothetical protein
MKRNVLELERDSLLKLKKVRRGFPGNKDKPVMMRYGIKIVADTGPELRKGKKRRGEQVRLS